MVGFEEYVALMTELLQLPEATDVGAGSNIYDDWGIDSLQSLELMLLTEQLAGLNVPPLEVPTILTLGDSYDYYRLCLGVARQEND